MSKQYSSFSFINDANLFLIKQVARFGVVGLGAATVHFFLVVMLVEGLKITPLLANFFAFIVSFQLSYWGHRQWTFNAAEVTHGVAISRLLLIQIVNLAASEGLFFLFLLFHLPYQLALMIVLAIFPCFTFIISKFWIFR